MGEKKVDSAALAADLEHVTNELKRLMSEQGATDHHDLNKRNSATIFTSSGKIGKHVGMGGKAGDHAAKDLEDLEDEERKSRTDSLG